MGPDAIAYLRKFESDELQKLKAKAKPGEQIKLQIVYDEIQVNPYKKTILIDSRKAQKNNLAETPWKSPYRQATATQNLSKT